MSCLARQAKVLVAEAEEDNLEHKELTVRWRRWDTCSLCEQEYHGVVRCALGWACWKTYLGRSEMNGARCMAMNVLGLGLSEAEHNTDALSVRESELSIMRRRGTSEEQMLAMQTNLALAYGKLRRMEDSLRIRQDVYSGRLKLNGEEHGKTLTAANNYAISLVRGQRIEEAKSLLRKTIPVAQRILRDGDATMLQMRWNYARALCMDTGTTLDDLREAVTTLEETERIAQHVLGAVHPTTVGIERDLQISRAMLRARETPPA